MIQCLRLRNPGGIHFRGKSRVFPLTYANNPPVGTPKHPPTPKIQFTNYSTLNCENAMQTPHFCELLFPVFLFSGHPKPESFLINTYFLASSSIAVVASFQRPREAPPTLSREQIMTIYPTTITDGTGRIWQWSDAWQGYRSEGRMTHGYDTIKAQWGIA